MCGMAREPLSLHAFALVVVRHERRFLMIQERKDERGWYFPAGRVDPGETFTAAAVRETREEAGVDVTLAGLYRIEHRPGPRGTRVRAWFAATADPRAPVKQDADEHSLQAAWLTRDQLAARTLRGDEVLDVVDGVLAGAPVHPLALLVEELRGWGA